MASFNRVILVGNLTRDIELRHIPSGAAVTDVGLAVNERVKRNEQWVDEVNYFDITLWGRTAEIAAMYLSKGSAILVEGRLKQETWEQDGQKRSKVKIIGEKMQMLGARSSGGPHGNGSMDESSNDGHHASEMATSAQGSTSSTSPNSSQGPPPSDEVPF